MLSQNEKKMHIELGEARFHASIFEVDTNICQK